MLTIRYTIDAKILQSMWPCTNCSRLSCVLVDPVQKYYRIMDARGFVLQKRFAENAYPTKATLRMLSEQLGLSESRVASWFACRRRSVGRGKHKESLSIGENVSTAV